MGRVTLFVFFPPCLTALWKGQPIKAQINSSIMCVCGFYHTLALPLASHEYTSCAIEGSAVQSNKRVSGFELSPPLFDIGSDVATREESWAVVSCCHALPPLICGTGPQGVFVRPPGLWHAILILQLLLSSFMSINHILPLRPNVLPPIWLAEVQLKCDYC